MWIRAPEKPGKYLIQCLNYCGLGHAQMKAWLVVGGDEAGPSTTMPEIPSIPGMPGMTAPAAPAAPGNG
jgi:heme/copper-type cytochrome/quinol oxidase subunit 2